jgi:opacity protein-like surface antigen
MNMKKMILIGFIMLLFGKASFAQHLGELTANYSYMHYVPVANLPTTNLNGGGGSVVLYFAGFFGLKAEVQGYANQNINFNFPPGSIRCPSGCTGTAQANLFTGNFGPQIKIRIKRVQPFFEGMVGGAHTNFYQNVHKNCSGCVFASPGDWALGVVLGGGLDIKVTSHLAIRPIEANYFLTRFINNLTTGHNNQNNFRYQAGLVFEF